MPSMRILRRGGLRRPAPSVVGKARSFPLTLLPAVVLLVVAVLVLMGSAFSPALAHPSSFPDVSESHAAHDAIEFMTGAGIISGFKDGTFGPGKTLTRGQATKMLVLWQDVTPAGPVTRFVDVDSVYRTYVETAASRGWITGFPDGTFRPYSTLSRQQMAIIVVRAMGWETDATQLSNSKIEGVLAAFGDEAQIAQVARPYVALAVQKGLFGGSGGCFNPKDGITRAQFSLVMLRAELGLRSVIQQVRSSADYSDRTRVVIDLSRAPSTATASISANGVLNIDYTGGAIAGVLNQAIGSAEVKSVSARQADYDPRTVRISLCLARYKTFRVMSLAPSDDKGYRIVIDAYRRADGPAGDGPPLICVDAGHGGKDTGAVGVSGAFEKDVNLLIAQMLADDLRKAGLGVIMTRSDDTFVELKQRAEIANTAQANLFVSVHNNAHSDPTIEGTETFYWGTPSKYSAEGKLLAEAIQRNLVEAMASVDRTARTHWFNLTVLAETKMTAVLTEVGFMTNAAEEAKILNPECQAAAAEGIAKGIMEYLKWSTTVYTTE